MHPVLTFLHIASVVIWVGGMFFAWMCLRPVAAETLEPPLRLKLWLGVFQRFFPWVWVAVVLILTSGTLGLLAQGFKQAPLHWHAMLLLGLTMSAVFVYVFTVPYSALKVAVATASWPTGGEALGRMRRLIGTNLVLGLVTIGVATLGRLA